MRPIEKIMQGEATLRKPSRAKDCPNCRIDVHENHTGVHLCPKCRKVVRLSYKVFKASGSMARRDRDDCLHDATVNGRCYFCGEPRPVLVNSKDRRDWATAPQ